MLRVAFAGLLPSTAPVIGTFHGDGVLGPGVKSPELATPGMWLIKSMISFQAKKRTAEAVLE
jgi:hypothetical protein